MTPRYWAFLSYSHADEAAATKLHRALESYTLPASVRKAHGLPRRLVPVFRDVEELEASSGLTGRLQGALDESRWLIVLCSLAAAQSKYVNVEIEYFIGKHGAGKILCVLLEGEPAESFPPALLALPDEPLAADLRPGADPQLAVLKLIAAMATVGFTELRNREAAPVASPVSGCARETSGYDAAGLLVEENCFDATGKPHTRKDTGWATHRITLVNARPVKDEYFDAAGKPVKPKR